MENVRKQVEELRGDVRERDGRIAKVGQAALKALECHETRRTSPSLGSSAVCDAGVVCFLGPLQLSAELGRAQGQMAGMREAVASIEKEAGEAIKQADELEQRHEGELAALRGRLEEVEAAKESEGAAVRGQLQALQAKLEEVRARPGGRVTRCTHATGDAPRIAAP